jgi:hypothetical protein
MAQLTPEDIGSETFTDVRLELEQFIEFLMETGKDSLKAKIPDKRELHRAATTLGIATGAVVSVINQSESREVRNAALVNLWSALASAFVIGSHGTLSDNSKVAASHAQAQDAREKESKRRKEDPTPTMLVISKVVSQHLRPGDELHPWKTADAMLGDVNRALQAKGLRDVNRDRIVRFIKNNPARS